MRRGGRPAAGQGRARRSGTGLRWASPRGRRLALVGRRPHPTRDPRPAARSPAQKTGAAGGRRSVSSPFLPAPSRHRAAPRPPAGGRGGTGRGGEGRRGLAGESGTGREEGTEGRRESRRTAPPSSEIHPPRPQLAKAEPFSSSPSSPALRGPNLQMLQDFLAASVSNEL
ncbi:translation initiation factor IF-2-like isoform X1 [Sus scrofa]|uniref:translation initiation factor IF-2-like isoform X1 n=1 Tax=Sus scrofa TaxID=9823 RepID=UPI000A2B74F4|nr:translation initiation factor IF-2-like isoform X1 [Sus scrofa]